MAKQELGPRAGVVVMVGALGVMIIILSALALIVVKALADSPWGTFTIAATIPIALFMGIYMRFIRPGRIAEVSLIGFVLMMLAIVYGEDIAHSAYWGPIFTLTGPQLTLALVVYGFVASVLPVWLLLAPRDYLSTFLKLGVIIGLAIGILFALPDLKMPAVSRFIDGSGPVFAGSLFPFLFITIACGACSGFHALVASGTTPKLVERESHIRMIGYGAMLGESMVAIMALICASVLDPGVYFALNSPAAIIGKTVESAAQVINGWGFMVTPEMLAQVAPGRRREKHSVACRRCPDLCRRHGGDRYRNLPQQGDDGVLVSLRHPLRSAVHPHRRRCRHTRLPLHGAGPGWRLHSWLGQDAQPVR